MTFPLMPMPAINFSPPVVTFQGNVSSSSNLTTYSFAAVPIGTASADRYVIVAAHTDVGGASPTVVTIGGITADLLQANDGVGLFMALVPTGTTATITATYSSAVNRCALGIWSATNVSRADPISRNMANGTGLVASTVVTATHGAAVIAASTHSAGASIAWTGSGTERYDFFVGNSTRHSASHNSSLGAGTVTPTATNPSSVSWRIAAIILR